MKKTILFTALLFIILSINGQDNKFGVTAGYNSFIATVKFQGASVSNSASGFFVGAFMDISISEKFSIQPELLFSLVSTDGESGSMLLVPILGKYHLADKFNFQFGPFLDYSLEEDADGVKKLGIGLATGLAYEVNDNFSLFLRYSLGLNNRIESYEFTIDSPGDPLLTNLDFKTKLNFFLVGIGYKF